MVKFYKPGKVVIILNGRFAGRKGIIVKSNYDGVKDKKYPSCTIVGLSKGPKKPTKKNLSKLQERIRKFESSGKEEKAKFLKSFRIFVKTYNMSHLLATRYTVKEEFGLTDSITKLENLDKKIKEYDALFKQKEKNKKEEKNEKDKDGKDINQKEIEELKGKLGSQRDEYNKEKKNIRTNIGAEMFKRYMQGFNKGGEEQQHTEFLFKKLHF